MKRKRGRALQRRYGHARKADPRVRAKKLLAKAGTWRRKADVATRMMTSAKLKAEAYAEKRAVALNEASALTALAKSIV
jgi:hypothetical protein